MRLFTEEQTIFVKNNAKDRTVRELTKLINDYFNMDINERQIRAYKKNHGVKSGVNGRFHKGHVPANKGTKGIYNVGGNKTSFKPGFKSHNFKQVGYERVDNEGYVLVKVSDYGPWHKRWRHKHRLVWEEINGPVPPGKVLLFGDGDKQNISMDNLLLISRGQLGIMNQKSLIQKDVELTKTGVIIADLYSKMSEKAKSNKGRTTG